MSDEQRPAEVDAYEEVYADVPGWPRLVGILSIVWGSLGIVCGGCMTLSSAFMRNLLKMAEEQNGPAPEAMITPPALVASMGFGTLVTILLLVAGITTLKRSITGRTLHLIYAVLSILNSVAGLWLSLEQHKAMAEWASQNAGNPYAANANMGGMNTMIAVVFTAIAVAYPLFILIWFGLIKRAQASMTGLPDELSGS